jgi:hypothetical protein
MHDQKLDKPLEFIKAGKAIFTIMNTKTGNRFTYKVKKVKNKKLWFVSVLNGPDNYSNYSYIGAIFGDDFRHTKSSKVNKDAVSFQAFAWTLKQLQQGTLPEVVTIHHEGRCGRCGRRLTVPESIESGYGPECIKLVNPNYGQMELPL